MPFAPFCPRPLLPSGPFARIAFSPGLSLGSVPTAARPRRCRDSAWRRGAGRHDRHAYAVMNHLGEHIEKNAPQRKLSQNKSQWVICSPRCFIIDGQCRFLATPSFGCLRGGAETEPRPVRWLGHRAGRNPAWCRRDSKRSPQGPEPRNVTAARLASSRWGFLASASRQRVCQSLALAGLPAGPTPVRPIARRPDVRKARYPYGPSPAGPMPVRPAARKPAARTARNKNPTVGTAPLVGSSCFRFALPQVPEPRNLRFELRTENLERET